MVRSRRSLLAAAVASLVLARQSPAARAAAELCAAPPAAWSGRLRRQPLTMRDSQAALRRKLKANEAETAFAWNCMERWQELPEEALGPLLAEYNALVPEWVRIRNLLIRWRERNERRRRRQKR